MDGYATKNVKFLRNLHRNPQAVRIPIIKSCTQDQTLALCECADNILRGNVILSEKEKKSIGKHKDTLRRIAGKGTWRQKKKIIQTGEGLPAIAAILSVVIPAIIELIKKK